jgi:predicted Rossmann fold nucleotide-binding protein DprA/Smf involved in DNA uptake
MERAQTKRPRDLSRDLDLADLRSIGYSLDQAQHILKLLDEESLLDWYLSRAQKAGITPITRASKSYPAILRQRLGKESPGCLWGRGEVSLLNTKAIALVGSRELRPENRTFAESVGRQAALQGLTLVSGNARGADRAAQDACLEAGGSVISVVPDSLIQHSARDRVLYLSELDYDMEFSSHRALSRNRVIHCLGYKTFVAQSTLGKGGTWDGTEKNLRYGWSEVYCYDDGSRSNADLCRRGANPIDQEALLDLSDLPEAAKPFF